MSKDTRSLMVSIWCITYNHEPYIRQCLDGFVMQKTNFRFEAIVHDDASTDGTAAIVKEYAEKYPDIIKPILETENQYSKQDGSLERICREMCNGKYFAICEGDDFWTDPYKLQKQVDFLEANPEYSMCFHSVCVKDNGVDNYQLFKHLKEGIYEGDAVVQKWTVPTCSIVGKRECIKSIPWDNRFNVGDIVIVLTCASFGKLYCINEKMGVYNKNQTGWVSKNENIERFYKSLSHQDAMLEYFPQFRNSFLDVKMRYVIRIIHFYVQTNFFKSLPWILKGMLTPMRFIKQFIWMSKNRK